MIDAGLFGKSIPERKKPADRGRYVRRDCIGDPDCERPVVSRGMCRRHATTNQN